MVLANRRSESELKPKEGIKIITAEYLEDPYYCNDRLGYL